MERKALPDERDDDDGSWESGDGWPMSAAGRGTFLAAVAAAGLLALLNVWLQS